MFSREEYLGGFPHVSEVRFDYQPNDDVVRMLIDRYFGGSEMSYRDRTESVDGQPLHLWRFVLPGRVHEGARDARRYIEAALDRDTFGGTRSEPFYFLVRNEKGDDAFTLAVAAGLAKFIAYEMNGQLVT